MPEIANVVTETVATSEWANAIRDRTIQRYDDKTTRDSEHAAPSAGDFAFMEDTGDVARYVNGAWHNLFPTGIVVSFAGTTAPPGFLFCHGQAVSRTTYASLFAVIGTTYGNGDGSTTFNLPDLRQRFPMGKAASGTGNVLGSTGGALTQVLTISHLPAHTHSEGSHSHTAGTLSTSSTGGHSHTIARRDAPVTSQAHGHPGNLERVAGASGTDGNNVNQNTGSVANHSHTITGNTGSTNLGNTGSAGSGNSFSKLPPYQVLNFIIKT